jgi:hypothetical protein
LLEPGHHTRWRDLSTGRHQRDFVAFAYARERANSP